MSKKEVQDDYDFTRSMYYNLAEKGQEGIELLLDLARESEHPRAFEVLSNSIRQNADVVEKLMKLQKDKKEIDHDEAGWLSYCLNHFIILPIMSLLNLFHLQAELSEDDESCAPKGHYHTIIAGNDMVVGSEDLNFLCEQTESLDHHTHMSVLIASAQPVAKAVEKILTQ